MDSRNADIARVALIFSYSTHRGENPPAFKPCRSYRLEYICLRHQVYPAVFPTETSRTRSVSPMHTPLPHPSLPDCVAPTHNDPQGTNCDSIFCIECTLHESYSLGPNRSPPQIFKYLMESLVMIRSFTAVLIGLFLSFFLVFGEDFSRD